MPGLETGDRFGDFEVVGFSEKYDDYRIVALEFRYDGWKQEEVKIYSDLRLENIIGSYKAYPGDSFAVDITDLKANRIYLKVGNRLRAIRLAGRSTPDIGDRYLACTVIDAYEIPVGPPHYIDLTLEYTGTAEPVSVTAYDGQREAVIGIYEVDPVVDPAFIIDGSEQHGGHIWGKPCA